MENKKILREIKKGDKENKIFTNQKGEDLSEVYAIIQDEYDKEIAVHFEFKDFYYALFAIRTTDYEETLKRCDQYIALRLMDELQENCPVERNRDLERRDDDMFHSRRYNGDKNFDYKKVKDKLYGTDEVIALIGKDYDISRIHFLINGIPSEILSDSLTKFLRPNLPFNTSIYVSQGRFLSDTIPDRHEIRYISDEYEYTVFDGQDEGVKNIPKKKKEYSKVINEAV